MTNNNIRLFISFNFILIIVLAVCKYTSLISCSWWCVLVPAWGNFLVICTWVLVSLFLMEIY